MHSHSASKNSMYSYKYATHKRRTTSTVIRNSGDIALHKTSNSIGSSFLYYDSRIEKIKHEIKERLKEQQKREDFLKNILNVDNEPSHTELYTETTRKSDIKTSESTQNTSSFYLFCLKKVFCKCFG